MEFFQLFILIDVFLDGGETGESDPGKRVNAPSFAVNDKIAGIEIDKTKIGRCLFFPDGLVDGQIVFQGMPRGTESEHPGNLFVTHIDTHF